MHTVTRTANMIDNNKLRIQLFRTGRQKMPKCFYQRQNEQAINATHTHIHIHVLYTAHKVSDKIVLILKKKKKTITIY